MGLLSRLAGWVEHRSIENPRTSLANPSEWLISWLGNQTDAGISVNEESAMRSAAVFACVRVISETLSSLPVHIYERSASGSTKVEAGIYNRMLGVEPNPLMSSSTFRECLTSHLASWGNAYSEIVRNGRGEAVELWPLRPDRTLPEWRKIGDDEFPTRLVYRTVGENGQVRLIRDEDVLHLRLFSPDGLIGLSPIAQSRNAIGLSMAAEKFGSTFYLNGAIPGTVLLSPKALSDKAAQRIRDSFGSRHQGAGNAHKTVVLEDGLTIESIGIPPADAQHLENRRFQLEEIARVFRVPLSFLQSSVGNTFANSEAQDIHFAKYTITPYITRWEQEINRKIFTGQQASRYYVKFNLNGLQRGVFRDRMDALVKAVQGGVMTPNEARALEDLPPMEGGDSLFLQQNLAGVQAIADGTAGNNVQNAIEADPAEPVADEGETE
jgi:HK97 family phage portal protein